MVLLAALAGFVLVFALRLVRDDPGDGKFLYIVPICVIAIEFGRTWGVVSGLVALALVVVWSAIDDTGLTFVAYLTRGVSFVVVGWVTGRMADRLRTAADDAFDGRAPCRADARPRLHGGPPTGASSSSTAPWTETLGWKRAGAAARSRSSSSCIPRIASARSSRRRGSGPASDPSRCATATARRTAASAGSSGRRASIPPTG